jgi:hypothetical protein
MPSPVEIELAPRAESRLPSDTLIASTEILAVSPVQATPVDAPSADALAPELDPLEALPSAAADSRASEGAALPLHIAAPDVVEVKASAPQNVSNQRPQIPQFDSLEIAPPATAGLFPSALDVQHVYGYDTAAVEGQEAEEALTTAPTAQDSPALLQLADPIDPSSRAQVPTVPAPLALLTGTPPPGEAPTLAVGLPEQPALGPLPGSPVTMPEPPGPGTILQEQKTNRPDAVERIMRYVQRYDGGPCFFVAPVEVTENTAKLEGYGASPQPFEELDAAFLHENGFEASIDVRLVVPAQCPAVRLLSRLRGPDAPHLHIDATRLGPGAPLTGRVDATANRSLELLLVTNTGAVRSLSRLFRPDATGQTFKVNLADLEGAFMGQPQLLVAIASAHPLDILRFDGAMTVDRLLASVLAETSRTNEPVSAMARYFKFEQ